MRASKRPRAAGSGPYRVRPTMPVPHGLPRTASPPRAAGRADRPPVRRGRVRRPAARPSRSAAPSRWTANRSRGRSSPSTWSVTTRKAGRRPGRRTKPARSVSRRGTRTAPGRGNTRSSSSRTSWRTRNVKIPDFPDTPEGRNQRDHFVWKQFGDDQVAVQERPAGQVRRPEDHPADVQGSGRRPGPLPADQQVTASGLPPRRRAAPHR